MKTSRNNYLFSVLFVIRVESKAKMNETINMILISLIILPDFCFPFTQDVFQ